MKPVQNLTAKEKSLKFVNPQPIDLVETLDTHEKIAFEAYLLAEKRGFQGGDPVADWLEAKAKLGYTH